MLYYHTINNRKIVARLEVLKQIIKAHKELERLGVGITVGSRKYTGLLIGAIKTSSWRSYQIQRELFDNGKSPTMNSNHRRGVAIDVFPDINYVRKIQSILRKHGLFNDISGDSVHFNYKSNKEARNFGIINSSNTVKYNDMKHLKTDNEIVQQLLAKLVCGISEADYKKLMDGDERVKAGIRRQLIKNAEKAPLAVIRVESGGKIMIQDN